VGAAAIFGAALTASLGVWQLDRATQKNAIQASILEKNGLPALDNRVWAAIKSIANSNSPAKNLAPLLHRNAVFTGHWLHEHTVYLDNRQMQGKPGFYVLTPLKLQDSESVVVVQRGWMQRNFLDRNQVADVPTPTDVVQVAGRITAAPSRLFELGTVQPLIAPSGAPSANTTPRIRQNLDLAAFAAETRLDVLPMTLLQTAPSGSVADGLQRNWPVIDAGVAKHYGYAFQWFGLCALIMALYIWFQFIAPRRGRSLHQSTHA
jgi:surfeit locus 1 family protein